MKDLMLDLETFSTSSNALILSISAVQFDFETGKIGKEFNIRPNINEQIVKGAVLDGNTIEWWIFQNKDAFSELSKIVCSPVDVVTTLFNEFIRDNEIQTIWGNGCTFDNVILRNMYNRHSKAFPLNYWADRDVRTVRDIFGIDTREVKFEGIKHNGIDDCKFQIEYLTNKKYRKQQRGY